VLTVVGAENLADAVATGLLVSSLRFEIGENKLFRRPWNKVLMRTGSYRARYPNETVELRAV
jgi:hypothetical protein